MQKENLFFFSFPSESNLYKVTNKRGKSAIKRATCKLCLPMSEWELIIKMQKENLFFSFHFRAGETLKFAWKMGVLRWVAEWGKIGKKY